MIRYKWIGPIGPIGLIVALLATMASAKEYTASPLLSTALSAPLPSAEFPNVQIVDTTRPQKSKAWAGFFSAVLPGMGELYAGRYDAGKYFTVSEAVLWLGYAGMTIFGNSMLNDATTYGAAHSGANTAGKDDAFLTNIANFSNSGQYNEKKARDGDFRLVYTTADYYWQWDNADNRGNFRSMHLRANGILDNTKYLLAAIVVNHMASAIDAVIQVNKVNHNISVSAAPTFENGAWGTKMEMQWSW